ncbi:MAG: hypothetical protein ACI92S_002706, partial [Planctomycetaceae bacterium]
GVAFAGASSAKQLATGEPAQRIVAIRNWQMRRGMIVSGGKIFGRARA